MKKKSENNVLSKRSPKTDPCSTPKNISVKLNLFVYNLAMKRSWKRLSKFFDRSVRSAQIFFFQRPMSIFPALLIDSVEH